MNLIISPPETGDLEMASKQYGDFLKNPSNNFD
jgi:hypothetical protein